MRTLGKRAIHRRTGGFTLLELMITAAVMGMVIMIVTAAMVNAMRTYSPNVTITNLEAAAGSVAERLTEELTHAMAINVNADGTEVTFSLPVDGDGSGTPLDKDSNIELGYGNTAGDRRRVRYVVHQTIDESIIGHDINNNGTTNDRYFSGRLVVDTLDSAGISLGNETAISPAFVLATAPAAGLDVDGDGSEDWIFRRVNADGSDNPLNGPILRVRLIQGRVDDEAHFHVTSRTVLIQLRNL